MRPTPAEELMERSVEAARSVDCKPTRPACSGSPSSTPSAEGMWFVITSSSRFTPTSRIFIRCLLQYRMVRASPASVNGCFWDRSPEGLRAAVVRCSPRRLGSRRLAGMGLNRRRSREWRKPREIRLPWESAPAQARALSRLLCAVPTVRESRQ